MNGGLPYDPDAVENYIFQSAQDRGIDPYVALKVARSEGLMSYTGDQGTSFGPFQFHYGGLVRGPNSVSGVGDEFTRDTGLDARNPNTVFSQIDYALNHAAQHGWGAFHGWKGHPMAGLQGAKSIPPSPDLLDQYAGSSSTSRASPSLQSGPDLLDQWSTEVSKPTPPPVQAPQPSVAAPTQTQQISFTQQPQLSAVSGPLGASPSDTMATAAAKSMSTGAIRGVGDIVGLPQTLAGVSDWLEDRVRSYLTGKPVEQVTQERTNALAKLHELDAQSPFGRILNAVDPRQVMPTAQSATEWMLPGGGYQPQSLFGRMAQSGIETAVGSLAPGISGPVSATRAALATSGGIGAVGTGTAEVTGSPMAGLAASVLLPVGAAGAAKGLGGSLISTVERDTAQLAAVARDKYGIPITAPQMAPASSAARFAGSTINRLPFSGAESTIAAQQGSFNRAVSNTIGENALKLTPDVMKDARTRIGQVFDDVGSRTTINIDPPFENELLTTLTNAGHELSESQMKPLMASFSNIMDKVSPGGTIDGKAYQALVAKNSPLDRAIDSQDGYLSHYAGQIKDSLDDAFQRSASPDDQTALSGARREWAALKTIEPIVAKAPTGDISPALLTGRVNQQTHNGLAYGYGGNLGELARIGTRFLKELPSSGTAERATIIGGLGEIGRAMAYGGGALGLGEIMKGIPEISPGEALMGAAAIPAGLAAGRLAGSTLRSRWLSNALINRSLGTGGPSASSYLARASLPYLLRQAQTLSPSP